MPIPTERVSESLTGLMKGIALPKPVFEDGEGECFFKVKDFEEQEKIKET